MPTADEVAKLLALLMVRYGKNRARVSAKTVKYLAARQKLRAAFVLEIQEKLPDYGYYLIEASRSFGLIATASLDGAPVVRARDYILELAKDLRLGRTLDWEGIHAELGSLDDGEDEDSETEAP